MKTKSIVFPITTLFSIFFIILLGVMLGSIYTNITVMYDRVTEERTIGIQNVIYTTFTNETHLLEHAIRLLKPTLIESNDIKYDIKKQSYIIDQLDFVSLTKNNTDVFISDKLKILDLLPKLSVAAQSTDIHFTIIPIDDNNEKYIMIVGYINFIIDSDEYTLLIGVNSDVKTIKLASDIHFKLFYNNELIINNGLSKNDESVIKYTSVVDRHFKLFSNDLQLITFIQQNKFDIFGYSNLIFTIALIVLIVGMYIVVVYYLFNTVIHPLNTLKTKLLNQCSELSKFNVNISPMINVIDQNEIKCLIQCFNIFIEHINYNIELIIKQKEKLTNLINSLDVGILEIDFATHQIITINKYALTLLGVTEDTILNKPCIDFLCSDASKCFDGNKINCIVCGTNTLTSRRSECFVTNKLTNNRIYVLKSLTNIYNEESVLITLVSLIDISNIKEKEDELQKAVSRADRATMGKTLLLGNVSHDIGNILTSLLGSAEILKDTTLDENQNQYLETIIGDCHSIAQAVDLMREKTLLETGQSKLILQDFDLSKVLIRIYRSCQLKCHDKQIEFNYSGIITDMHRSTPFCIKSDPGKISAVISNLLDNAIKFTNSGSVICNINHCNSSRDLVTLTFVIIDTGIGIKSDEQKSIFKIYEQANEDIQTVYGGTGIGLSICQHYINLLGGTIELESSFGKGSTFKFSISVKMSDACKSNELTSIIQPTFMDESLQILVAEDNPSIQNVANDKLRKFKCIPTIVSNGKDLVTAINNQYFDMAFVDIRMPIMTGTDAVKILRGDKFKIPLIALTANSSELNIIEYLSVGFDDYMGKPIIDDQLIFFINKYKTRQLLDLEYIKSNYDTPEFYLSILKSAKTEFTLHIEMLENFKTDTNFVNIQHYINASHSIKSISSQLGMESVRHISHILETKFTIGINFKDIQPIVNLIDQLTIQFQKSLNYYDVQSHI